MKKQIALAAVLATVLTLTACGDKSENKSGGNSSSSVASTESSSKASENKSTPKPSSDASYTPVVNNVGDIVTEGDTQYFECTSKYGDAFTSVYRYTYKNGKIADASSKIIPGKETELAVIIENMGEDSGVKTSDFTQDGDGWIMTMPQEMLTAYQSIDILSLRSMMAMSMPSDSDSQNDPFASDPTPSTSDTTPDTSDPVIVVSAEKDYLYEPVTTTIGEIVTYGDDQYFESYTNYGTACTIIYRYYFTKGIFDHAEMRVRPNAISDFKEIYDRHYVTDIARYDYSDFAKEFDDYLLLNTTYLKEEAQFFEGVDILALHSTMQSMYS